MKQNYFIKFTVFICILMFSFSNVFASKVEQDLEQDRQLTTEHKEACLKFKQNNFQDFTNPIPRFSYLYLNALLDYITEHNKDILKEKGLENQKFCIYISDNNEEDTGDKGNGLIRFNVNDLILPFLEDNDVDTATAIVHELAHDILNHKRKISDILVGLYKEFMKNDIIKDKSHSSWESFYKKHPLFIEQSRLYEIEADELGFKLYLNSGFVPGKYGLYLLKTSKITFYYHVFNISKTGKTVFSQLSDKDFSLFQTISTTEGCMKLGKESLAQKQLDNFMNRIKYIPNFIEDVHPTNCWRFWNITEKMLALDNLDNLLEKNTTLHAIFLKIDLSKYEYLNNLKYSFKKQDLKLIEESMFIAVNETINDNYSSPTMKYSVDTKSRRTNFNESDNSLVIPLYSFLIRPLLVIVHNTDSNKK